MAYIHDVLPNDAEIAALTTPTNHQALRELQHRKVIRRRLENCLERIQLRHNLGLEDEND